MAKVFKLVQPAKNNIITPPNEHVLRMLSDLQTWADSGVLQQIVVVGILDSGDMVDGWSHLPDGKPYQVLGAITKLSYEFAAIEIQGR